MNLYSLLVNILFAAIFAVILFWLLSLIAVGLPVVAVLLLKVFIILIAVGWVCGLMGPRIVS